MVGGAHRPVIARRGGQSGDEMAYADECPLLLISEASLADLNGRLAQPIPMRQFRPNLVVAGCLPFEEDNWRRVRIGEVEYDARKGGANMGKFGRTAEKIRPLLDELLKDVKRLPSGQGRPMG